MKNSSSSVNISWDESFWGEILSNGGTRPNVDQSGDIWGDGGRELSTKEQAALWEALLSVKSFFTRLLSRTARWMLSRREERSACCLWPLIRAVSPALLEKSKWIETFLAVLIRLIPAGWPWHHIKSPSLLLLVKENVIFRYLSVIV